VSRPEQPTQPTGDPRTVPVAGPTRRIRTAVRGAFADTRPLRTPSYRRLWLAGAVTTVGAQLSVVAVPTQIYQLTGSSAWVGLTGVFGLVPLIVFGLWGGAIADAVDRRTLLLASGAGIAASALLLWVTSASGLGGVWLVLSLFAVQTALPALYLLDAIALLATLWATWRLPALPPERRAGAAKQRAGLREVVAGFRYAAAYPVLLVSFLIDVVAMGFGMPRVVFPEISQTVFGDPPGGGPALGLLFAAIPIGMVVAGLFSGWLHRVRRHGVAVTAAICVWGVSVALFGTTSSLLLAVVFLAVGGAADLVSSVYRTSILQTVATDEMRGRMQGVFLVVVAGGPRLADLWHGPAAAWVGPGAAAVVGGVAVVVGALVVVRCYPVFWRYRAPG
jgi:MFS family permease